MISKYLKMLALLIGCILCGTFLMEAIYLLPVQSMNRNMKESAETFQQEGTYPRVMSRIGGKASQLDNFTDALMLLNAGYDGIESSNEKAMCVFRVNKIGSSPTDALIAYGNNEENLSAEEYPRYWHAYLLILKPLIAFFTYEQIRIINGMCQIILIGFFSYMMIKKKYGRYLAAFFSMYIFLNPFALIYSLQFSTVFYLFMIGMLAILLYHVKLKKNNRYLYFFMVMGILTSYFDFLTYPLATFGMPIIMLQLVDFENNWRNKTKNILQYAFCWSFGYVGMWAGKWCVATLLLDQNIFMNAYAAIQSRTAMKTDTEELSIFLVIKNNIIAGNIFMIPTLVVIFYYLKKLKINIFFNMNKIYIPYIIIAICPLLWYFMATNHSHIHFWFTYRELSITIFSMIVMLIQYNSNFNK